jgi:hypothetical protein
MKSDKLVKAFTFTLKATCLGDDVDDAFERLLVELRVDPEAAINSRVKYEALDYYYYLDGEKGALRSLVG